MVNRQCLLRKHEIVSRLDNAGTPGAGNWTWQQAMQGRGVQDMDMKHKWATTHRLGLTSRLPTKPSPSPAPNFFSPCSLGVFGLQAISSVFLFLCSILNHIFKKHFLKGKDWEKKY